MTELSSVVVDGGYNKKTNSLFLKTLFRQFYVFENACYQMKMLNIVARLPIKKPKIIQPIKQSHPNTKPAMPIPFPSK
jgi:hypothetical protein